MKKTPKSNDALYYDAQGNVVFIEFKNGRISLQVQRKLRKKIYDSVFILTDIAKCGISQMRCEVVYILVYNEERNPIEPQNPKHIPDSLHMTQIGQAILGFAQEELIQFDLEDFQGYCFKEVHTYTKEEFEKYLERVEGSVSAI